MLRNAVMAQVAADAATPQEHETRLVEEVVGAIEELLTQVKQGDELVRYEGAGRGSAAKEDLLAEGRQLGRLRGSTFAVTLAPWVAQAVRAGQFTWLNLHTLRQLGGIAARLWVYLEAESYKPAAQGLASTWIGLGRPALATFGADRYRRLRGPLRGLEVDARYASMRVEPRLGGWALVASRVVDRGRWKARREIVESLATASGQGSLDELRD